MEFHEVVCRRFMIRRYCTNPVPEDTVERIISAVLHGPSAGFAQGIDVIVVTEQEMRAVQRAGQACVGQWQWASMNT